jgi:hypothetical protein
MSKTQAQGACVRYECLKKKARILTSINNKPCEAPTTLMVFRLSVDSLKKMNRIPKKMHFFVNQN